MPINLDERSLNRYRDRALHRQIADVIRTAILTGQARPGEALPAEAELAAAAGVSRTSIREAFDILAAEGLIVKRSGVPSRVAARPPVRRMSTSRYLEEMDILAAGGEHPASSAFTVDHGIGWDAYTVTADYTRCPPGDVDAARLGLGSGTTVLRRHLVKYAAHVPVQIQDSVLPWDLVAGTPVADPARQPWPGGTLAELHSVGLVATRVREDACARPPTAAERGALEMAVAGPVLEIVRVFHVSARAVECSTVVVPAAGTVLRYDTELSPAR